MDQFLSYTDSLAKMTDAQEEEAERLKAINEQYKNLFAALKEQEEYYLQQRRHLNAEWSIENYQTTPVHDMILSPHGTFSTDPNDYIIATKNPQSLGGGSAPVYVTVINNSPSTLSMNWTATRKPKFMSCGTALENRSLIRSLKVLKCLS
jgi:hypothetical protein